MYQDWIIILGIIFFIYKLITHEGKLSLARVIMMRIKLKSIKSYIKGLYTHGYL